MIGSNSSVETVNTNLSPSLLHLIFNKSSNFSDKLVSNNLLQAIVVTNLSLVKILMSKSHNSLHLLTKSALFGPVRVMYSPQNGFDPEGNGKALELCCVVPKQAPTVDPNPSVDGVEVVEGAVVGALVLNDVDPKPNPFVELLVPVVVVPNVGSRVFVADVTVPNGEEEEVVVPQDGEETLVVVVVGGLKEKLDSPAAKFKQACLSIIFD